MIDSSDTTVGVMGVDAKSFQNKVHPKINVTSKRTKLFVKRIDFSSHKTCMKLQPSF